MAMTTCHACRKDVSTQAHVCPTCGAPVTTRVSNRSKFLFLLAVLGVGVPVVLGLTTMHQQAVLAEPQRQLASAVMAAPLPKSNGLYTAQVGAECVTRPHAWAALSLWDFERAYHMVGQDSAAFTKMVEAKRVLYLKEDLTLFVTKRIETGIHSIEVRPQGEIFELWMSAGWVDCGTTSAETTEIAKPAKPAKPTKPTKTTRGAR
jgi:hypothetical protein